jgi:MoxR-like ATPase
VELVDVKTICGKVKANVEKVIIGKGDVIDLLLTTIVAGGNVLLEDVPGTGKTVIAKSLAKSIGVDFKRVQFTPDLLPSDLTGINYFNQKESEFVLRQGPVFTNILLADEINRATPRTQSSLLECMEERQVTIDGVTHKLGNPFFVIATQNPVETQGTFQLPEAQLDRFLVKINMGYPTLEEGKKIFERFICDNPIEDLKEVCTLEDICEAKKVFSSVYVHNDIQNYILEIVEMTRKDDSILLGVSPRGSLALLKAVQAFAAIKGRNFVTTDDVKYLAPFVFEHRIILRDAIRIREMSGKRVIDNILEKVKVPTENWSESKN